MRLSARRVDGLARDRRVPGSPDVPGLHLDLFGSPTAIALSRTRTGAVLRSLRLSEPESAGRATRRRVSSLTAMSHDVLHDDKASIQEHDIASDKRELHPDIDHHAARRILLKTDLCTLPIAVMLYTWVRSALSIAPYRAVLRRPHVRLKHLWARAERSAAISATRASPAWIVTSSLRATTSIPHRRRGFAADARRG